MASSIFNAPCNIQAIKGLDRNSKFNCFKIAVKVRPPRTVVVRASERHDRPTEKRGLSDAECEAAVVAGNVPEAPPVPPKPAAPAGTPVVPSLVSIRRRMLL